VDDFMAVSRVGALLAVNLPWLLGFDFCIPPVMRQNPTERLTVFFLFAT
jgi:hypothetical protein